MSDAAVIRTERAAFEQQTDGWKVMLERELEAVPEQAWAWLTDPDHLQQWLAPGSHSRSGFCPKTRSPLARRAGMPISRCLKRQWPASLSVSR